MNSKFGSLRLPPKRGYRILMSADTVGGVWDYALELTRALESGGWDVVLAAMGRPPSTRQRAAASALTNLTLCARDLRLEWMDNPWRDVERAGAWLLDLEARCAPDLVHLNGYAHGALPWRAPTLVVGHSCVFSWFAAVRRTAPGPEWDEYRRRVALGLGAASLVTAPSRTMLEALREHYGFFAACEPVYNGRSAADFSPGVKEPLVLAAARIWDEAKNLRILETIAPDVAWPIYVAGDDRAPGTDLAVTLGGGITQLGRLDRSELAEWQSRAAIFLHPALYEPFGLAVLEAALAGCVLVLGDIPSLREIWAGAALFIGPENSAAWRATLKDLIASPNRRRALACAARQRALQFSPARMAREYTELYRQLMAGGANPGDKNAAPETTGHRQPRTGSRDRDWLKAGGRARNAHEA